MVEVSTMNNIPQMGEFEGKEYLKKGDLTEIAKILNLNPRTVQAVYQGKRNSDIVSSAINQLIKSRKEYVDNEVKKLAENKS